MSHRRHRRSRWRSSCRHRVPAFAARRPLVVALLVAACSAAGAGSAAAAGRRRRRPAPSTRPASAGLEPTAADRRPRLHPERPVRAVLPRRAGRLLRGGRPRRRRSRTRSIRTSSRSSAQGAIDVGIADGTSVIPAVSQGIPIRYIATIYGKFPIDRLRQGVVGDRDARPISKGKKIGIPGRYGSRWIMLQALLASAGLTPEDVEIVEYPTSRQRCAVPQGAVDAATGLRQQRARPARARRRAGHGPAHRRHHAAARARA